MTMPQETGAVPSEVFAVRHIDTQTYMPCRMTRGGAGGWSHWSPGAKPDSAGNPRDGSPYDRRPRLFYSLQAARNAISMWSAGIWVRDAGVSPGGPWGPDEHHDNLQPEEPPVPRSSDQMEIVHFTLTQGTAVVSIVPQVSPSKPYSGLNSGDLLAAMFRDGAGS